MDLFDERQFAAMEELRKKHRLSAMRTRILVKFFGEEIFDKYMTPLIASEGENTPEDWDGNIFQELMNLNAKLDTILTEEGLLEFAKNNNIVLNDSDFREIENTALEIVQDELNSNDD